MPSLRERIDTASITASFLALPKSKKYATAVGFLDGEPVASINGSGSSAGPYRWVGGKMERIVFQDVKKLAVRGASSSQLAGFWSTPKGDDRAVAWGRLADGSLAGTELHPPKWEKSTALACGDGQTVGFGYQVFVRDSSKALLWSGVRESVVILTGPDPAQDAMALGVAGGVQVGYTGGIRRHACLWHGSSDSYVDLHPGSGASGSEALGAGDGQQVGHVWGDEMMSRAALWSDTAASYVNLAPDRFKRSRANACARGFQAGWAADEADGMVMRAMLSSGDADDYVDMHSVLPAPWNVSWATAIDVDGDRLRVFGTAQQAVKSGGYEMNAGERPVIWEMRLLAAEPPARRGLPAEIVTAPASPDADTSAELAAQKVVADFAQAVIDSDYKTAYSLLAPWLRSQVTAKKLKTLIDTALIDGVAPVDFELSGNDSQLHELREGYAEYYQDDRSRTLATVDEFGQWGPPSIHIADDITADNFRGWMSLDLTPDPEGDSGLDYCLRLWLIVVTVDGTMRIGHLEPGD